MILYDILWYVDIAFSCFTSVDRSNSSGQGIDPEKLLILLQQLPNIIFFLFILRTSRRQAYPPLICKKMAQEMPLLTMILPLKMLMFRSKLAQMTKHYQLEMFISKIPSSIGDKLQLR